MTHFYDGADVVDPGYPWKARVVLASAATNPTGAIVRAMLGSNFKVGPAYGMTAEIDADGIVRTTVHAEDTTVWPNMPIGSIQAVRDEMRRLADHCKLSDEEREAFFDQLRKWIAKDARAISGLDVKAHN